MQYYYTVTTNISDQVLWYGGKWGAGDISGVMWTLVKFNVERFYA